MSRLRNVKSGMEFEGPIINKVQISFVFTKETDLYNASEIDLGISISPDKIQWEKSCRMNIVKETAVNGEIKEIRLCQIYKPSLSFDSTLPYQYAGVTKLDICTPVSFAFIFNFMSAFPYLECVRFGAAFFHNSKCYDSFVGKIDPSPFIKELHINFDKKYFDLTGKLDQNRIKNIMDQLLEFSATYLTGLTRLDVYVPVGSNLNLFFTKFPELKMMGVLGMLRIYTPNLQQ